MIISDWILFNHPIPALPSSFKRVGDSMYVRVSGFFATEKEARKLAEAWPKVLPKGYRVLQDRSKWSPLFKNEGDLIQGNAFIERRTFMGIVYWVVTIAYSARIDGWAATTLNSSPDQDLTPAKG